MEVNNETDPTSPTPNDPSTPHQSDNKPAIDIPQSIVSSHNSSLSFYGKESNSNSSH